MSDPAKSMERQETVRARLFQLTLSLMFMSLGGWGIVQIYDATESIVLSLGTGTALGALLAIQDRVWGGELPRSSGADKQIWVVIFAPLFLVLPAVGYYEVSRAGGIEFDTALVALLFGMLLGLSWKMLR